MRIVSGRLKRCAPSHAAAVLLVSSSRAAFAQPPMRVAGPQGKRAVSGIDGRDGSRWCRFSGGVAMALMGALIVCHSMIYWFAQMQQEEQDGVPAVFFLFLVCRTRTGPWRLSPTRPLGRCSHGLLYSSPSVASVSRTVSVVVWVACLGATSW